MAPANPSDIQPLAGDPLAGPDFQTVASVYNVSLTEIAIASDAYPSVLGNFLLTEVVVGVQDNISAFIPSSVKAQDVQPLAGDPLAAPDFPDGPAGTTYNVSWTDTLVVSERYTNTVVISLAVTENVAAQDNSIPTYGPIISMSDTLYVSEVWVVTTSHATFPSFGRAARLPWYVRAVDAIRLR